MSTAPNFQWVRSSVSRHGPSPTGTRGTSSRAQEVRVDLERAEEALQTLVVRIHLGCAPPKPVASSAQLTLRTLNRARRELRQKADSGTLPRQMLGQHRFKFVNRVVGGYLHWSACKKHLA